jgi:peptide-methionine (S)-S-oxide reductase
MAEMSDNFDYPIVTTIEDAINLTIAEEYHHDYYAKNPGNGYCQVTINPKLAKVRAKFSHLLR